jgi:hypothetical protein
MKPCKARTLWSNENQTGHIKMQTQFSSGLFMRHNENFRTIRASDGIVIDLIQA